METFKLALLQAVLVLLGLARGSFAAKYDLGISMRREPAPAASKVRKRSNDEPVQVITDSRGEPTVAYVQEERPQVPGLAQHRGRHRKEIYEVLASADVADVGEEEEEVSAGQAMEAVDRACSDLGEEELCAYPTQTTAEIEQETVGDMESLFGEDGNKFLAYLAELPPEQMAVQHHVLNDPRVAKAQARNLRALYRAHHQLQAALGRANMTGTGNATKWWGSITRWVRKTANKVKRHVHRAVHHVKKVVHHVKKHVKKVVHHVKKHVTKAVTHVKKHVKKAVQVAKKHVGKVAKLVAGGLAGVMKAVGLPKEIITAAFDAFKNLRTILSCVQNAPEERYRLKTVLRILSSSNNKPDALVRELLKVYVQGSLKDLEAIIKKCLTNGVATIKKIIASNSKMSLAEVWRGKWVLNTVDQMWNYVEDLSKSPGLGPFRCILTSVLKPAYQLVKQVIVNIVSSALIILKEAFSLVSKQAVKFVGKGMEMFANKFPQVKLVQSYVRDSATDFCMNRVKRNNQEIDLFLVKLQTGNATHEEYQRLRGKLHAPFKIPSLPELVKSGIAQVKYFVGKLLGGLVSQSSGAASASTDKVKKLVKKLAAKVTDFAKKHLLGPIKKGVDWLMMVAGKLVGQFTGVLTNFVNKVVTWLFKTVVSPSLNLASNMMMTVMDGVMYLLEGAAGFIPEAGAIVLDVVTEPMQAIEKLLTGRLYDVTNGFMDQVLKLAQQGFKFLQEQIVALMFKSGGLVTHALDFGTHLMVDVVPAVIDQAAASVKDGIKVFTNRTKQWLDGLLSKAGKYTTDLASLIFSKFDTVTGGVFSKVAAMLKLLQKPLFDLLRPLVDKIVPGLEKNLKTCDELGKTSAFMLEAAYNISLQDYEDQQVREEQDEDDLGDSEEE